MEQLNRKLPILNPQKNFPEKVLMFGEGVFLRAFACVAFEDMNQKGLFNGSVTIVQPLPKGKIDILKKQQGLFTVIERGIENSEKTVKTKIITCIRDGINPYTEYNKYIKCARNPELRFIVSNTTEAGISYREGELLTDKPQISFPGKVTALLYERFTFFKGDSAKGLVLLPCELIDANGTKLKELVHKLAKEWALGEDFLQWVDNSNVFANTLVDRIVAGYPGEEAEKIYNGLGYRDELLNACELFYFWAIEAPPFLKEELPLEEAGLNVVFSDNIAPHRLKKVRLLNGAHTCMAPAALLCGYHTVGETVSDSTFKNYLNKALFNEIIPALDIYKNILEGFANSITERFSNPFINHELIGITHNCVPKFKTRVLPTLLEYQKRFGKLPPILTFSFAAMIAFYKSGERFNISDDERNIALLRNNGIEIILCSLAAEWGVTLNHELIDAVRDMHDEIKKHGVKPIIERLAND